MGGDAVDKQSSLGYVCLTRQAKSVVPLSRTEDWHGIPRISAASSLSLSFSLSTRSSVSFVKSLSRGFFARSIVLLFSLLIASAATGCASKGSSPPPQTGESAARNSTARIPAAGSHEQRTYRNYSSQFGSYSAVYIEAPKMDTPGGPEPVNDFETPTTDIY